MGKDITSTGAASLMRLIASTFEDILDTTL